MDAYSSTFTLSATLGSLFLNGVQLKDNNLPLSGWVEIGQENACKEVMSYTSVAFSDNVATFQVNRSNNNYHCNHPKGAPVSWYVDPDDVAARTLAHEATHLLNVEKHTLDYWQISGRHTIMNTSLPGGSIGIHYDNNSLPSYWNDVQGCWWKRP